MRISEQHISKHQIHYFFFTLKSVFTLVLISLSSVQAKASGKATLQEYNTYLCFVDSLIEGMYNFEFDLQLSSSDTIDAATRMVGLYTYYYQFLAAKDATIKKKFDALLQTSTNYVDFEYQNVQLAKLSERLIQMRYARARGNYLSTAFLLDEIGNYFERTTMDSTISLSVLYWGLYSYYLSAIKEESFVFRGLLSAWKSPPKNEGFNRLKKLTHHSSRFISTEARYFLMRGLWELEEKPDEAILLANNLCSEYPLNLLYQWFRIRIIAEISGENTAQLEYEHTYANAKKSNLPAPFLDLFQKRCRKIWD